MTTYRAIMLQGKGGLDRLEDVSLPLTEPGPGELRVKVVATGAGSTDIMMRTSKYLFAPPFPFVPGYELVGTVDAIGAGVTGFTVGQRVAALTVHGAFAEYLVRSADDFVPVPEGVDDAAALSVILNYVTAYQMIHRSAKMAPGQTALVTGANGGVGTALCELLRLHGVHAIAACAPRHFDAVRALGAEPIPSREGPVDAAVHLVVPQGVDAAFDIVGGAGTRECIRATKRGGIVVGYGFMGATRKGKPSTLLTIRSFVALYVGTRLVGRRGTFYGITALYRKDKQPLKEDLPRLLELLRAGKIRPIVAHRLPLLAARRSQELLMAGGVVGKIVMLRELGVSDPPASA
ncbi:MAG TPA: zinc-binding dehydrogenase [Polyangiaceae bacterium]|nr:zinc-binding dehydrogenase [Polyangiaceae bacterium]